MEDDLRTCSDPHHDMSSTTYILKVCLTEYKTGQLIRINATSNFAWSFGSYWEVSLRSRAGVMHKQVKQ